MSEYRMGKNVKEHYTSFEEMAAAWKCKPVNRQTKDKKKLETQREKFCGRHLCKACGKNLTYILNTNIMICSNEKCKGIEIEYKDKTTGDTNYLYKTSYTILNDKSTEIASNLFENKE